MAKKTKSGTAEAAGKAVKQKTPPGNAKKKLHQTQAKLEAAGNKYFELYDLAPAGYFTIGMNGVIQETNLTAAKMTGMEKKNLIKKKFAQLIASEDQEIYRLSGTQLLETGKPQTCEIRLLCSDGAKVWTRCASFPITGAAGNIAQIRVVVMDISELKLERQRSRLFQRMLLEFQEKERARIAAELHDSLSQNMLVISNEIKLAQRYLPAGHPLGEKLAASSALALRTMDEILEIAHDLRPSHLDQLGLEKAVHSLTQRLVGSLPINIHVEIHLNGWKIPPDIEINVFRIIQEALNNIIKHSGAKNAFIDLGVSDNSLVLTITDDGMGFDVEKSLGTGFGLLGMMERAKSLNGDCTIKSGGADQTVFSCVIPLTPVNNGGPPW